LPAQDRYRDLWEGVIFLIEDFARQKCRRPAGTDRGFGRFFLCKDRLHQLKRENKGG
jgi:hypothetical protein